MLALNEAQTQLQEYCRNWLDQQTVSHQQTHISASLGRILAEDLHAPIDVPFEDLSAMDGYALCLGERQQAGADETFKVVGESRAGRPFAAKKSLVAGECVRIMTGAVVPASCNTVVMQEQVEPFAAAQQTTIRLLKPVSAAQNIRVKGEEINCGQLLFMRDERITPSTISALASQGISYIKTRPPVKVGFFSSGDELRHSGETLRSGNIFESNLSMIQALLQPLPLKLFNLGIVPDKPHALKSQLQQACKTLDVVISSGGVSVGDHDYIRDIVSSMGHIEQHKVAIKPGKPLCFGHVEDADARCLFFGLPGNPVSAFVTLQNIFIPALWQLAYCKLPPQKLQLSAQLQNPVRKRPGRTEFQRGILRADKDHHGTICWQVSPLCHQDSHRIYGLAQANCHIFLDADSGDLPAGSTVTVEPYHWCFSA